MSVTARFVLGCGLVLAVSAFGCSAGQSTGTHPDADFLVRDAGTPPDAGRDANVDAHIGRDGGPSCGTEICDNGLDDNCDTRIDENCPCVAGQTEACYHGTAATRGIGACHDGSASCVDGLEFGSWGDCTGDVLAGTEVCDAAGVDEDCDGAVNEGCECDPSAGTVACGTDVGACVAGTQTCGTDGHLGTCMGATAAGTETCNAIDDDCDGTTDEGITQACGSSTGACRAGTQTCVAGTFDTCAGAIAPGVEDCNGVDDDCDGSVDEMLTRACGSAIGACMPGTQACAAGAWGTCSGETSATIETCNDVDDDCDGVVDDGVTQPCGSSVGVCRPGTQTCTAGVFGACVGGVTPGTEVCDGSRDENCNGTVDEGCLCTVGAMRACGTDTGACAVGSQTCSSTGWGACMGGIGPVAEICNRVDDDCDALVDEGGICPVVPPVVTCPAPITGNVLSTVSVSATASDPAGGALTYTWTVTSRPTGSTSLPVSPTSASTRFYLDASGTYTLHFCATSAGGTSCCDVMITSVAPGDLHVELSWSTAYGDVDLHLLDTLRTADVGWFTADDCDYLNPAPDWPVTGSTAGNPRLDLDDTDGYGPENITITNMPASGTYTVGVHYFCQHSIGMGSIAPGDGPTTATVRIYCMGSLIATYTGIALTETDDFRDVATVDYPSCVGRSVNRLTNGSSVEPDTATTVAHHCAVSCTGSSDTTSCPAHERCALVGGGGPPRYQCIYAP